MIDTKIGVTQWVTQEDSYTISYDMIYSINPSFEEYELWEYGIHSTLYNNAHHILSEAEVAHISPDKEFVVQLVHKLMTYKVFPIHLYDVILDELESKYDYHSN